VGQALEASVDFVVISGDTYDGENPSLWAQLRFRESLERLSEAGVLCFLAHGNHDPAPSWQNSLELPQGVHRFSTEAVEGLPVERNGRLLARVFGISYESREEERDLANLFPHPPTDAFSIAVLHANVGSVARHRAYAATTLETLRGKGYCYWALGHVHQRAVLLPPAGPGAPVVVYPGFLQGRSVRELGPGGGYLVQVDEQSNIHLEFLASDRVRWQEIEVPLGQCPSKEALLDELLRCREANRDQARGLPVILRLVLTGRSQLHPMLQDATQIAALARALREGEAEREDFVWIESLNVSSTGPVFQQEKLEGRPDLVGAVAREGSARQKKPDAAQQIRARLAERPEAARIPQELAALKDDELLAILNEATARTLDLLL